VTYGVAVFGNRDLETRDRDPRGRAKNARPRDALGRPLAYGEVGVEPVPEDLVLTPDESLAEAQRLLDSGRPFQAHEVLEASWKSAAPQERELWRGLAQLAVGVTHLARGNLAGGVRLLRRGAGHLGPYVDTPPHGIDVAGLTAWASSLADAVSTGEPTSRGTAAGGARASGAGAQAGAGELDASLLPLLAPRLRG
jgi:hypothetical protein